MNFLTIFIKPLTGLSDFESVNCFVIVPIYNADSQTD